jgi:hypothetical protein
MRRSNKLQSDRPDSLLSHPVSERGFEQSTSVAALRDGQIDQQEYLRQRIEAHLEAWTGVFTADELALLRASLQIAVAADPHVDQLCAALTDASILADEDDGSAP